MRISLTKERILSFFVFVASASFAFFAVNWFSVSLGEFIYEKNAASLYGSLNGNTGHYEDEKKQSDGEDFVINAKSIISVKFNGSKEEILFSKNDREKLPIASLTKLMSALVVLENYDLKQSLTISSLASSQVGDQGSLKEGEVLPVESIFKIMLVESSNKAAFALSELVGKDEFIGLMNLRAKEMGLKNTHFEDSTGLSPGSYSTVDDLAKLSVHLFNNYPLFGEVISLKEYDLYLPDGRFHHKLINTNKLLGQLEGVVGGKTGWTDFSKGCLMVIQKDLGGEDYLIHIILGAEDRLAEMEKLINLINIFYKG